MKIRIPLSILGLVLALGFPARASLVWENPEVDLHPTLSDKTAVAHFKYKNTGDQPVKITQVQPSCGCTTAAPPKDAVAPGESGEIVATFNIGDRSGEQTKTIHVRTDDAKSEGTVLKLKATIPQLLEFAPAFLYWRRGEERAPKTIEVKVGDFPVTKLEVTSTDPAIKVQSAAVPNEKAFRITVTPETGNRPVNAALKIQPDFPKEAPKTFYANVRVDAPVSAAAGAKPASTPVALAPPAPDPKKSPAAVTSPAIFVPPPK
jgi:Protein of unknown function (DUF1573)